MSRGQDSLDQKGAQGNEQQKGGIDPELLKKLLEMFGGGAGGAQGGGGSSGSGGSGGQPDPEQINKMMAGREGMQAMMPDSDNGRQIQV
ncbi:hypothetical protein [Pseudomonas rhodesiae]|uniref:hypothetical protein n=1 Tax=Pseudomonas rhodesiae TaxID=76760 RepID=UPI0032B21A8D